MKQERSMGKRKSVILIEGSWILTKWTLEWEHLNTIEAKEDRWLMEAR